MKHLLDSARGVDDDFALGLLVHKGRSRRDEHPRLPGPPAERHRHVVRPARDAVLLADNQQAFGPSHTAAA